MRNRETDRQADRQTTMYEQMMNIVRRKRGGEGKRKRCFIVLFVGRAYVPSTSESKDRGGRGWVVGEKGGRMGVDRMKRERRPDQTQVIGAGVKGK